MSDDMVLKKDPPSPVNGVEYEWLAEDKLCQECGRLVIAGQIVVRRNARGRIFQEFLPMKHGICLNCAANGLSEISVKQYENILKQIQAYEALNEKTEVTEQEEKRVRIMGRYIENLQEFVDELGKFVEHTEESGVAYYDDQIETEEDND